MNMAEMPKQIPCMSKNVLGNKAILILILRWISRIITVFYLWRAEKRRRRQLPWVHQILQGREQFGDYHHLLQELRLDDGRFQRYFRLSRTQFEDLLSRVGRQISLQDTNYRHYIPAADRLSICLRHIQSLID
ncbi:hypothetical protein ILYODFUR_027556 [Ilyodon furcidens]|uniref:Uncharacterized protein n=1 Tax=Ilyodon furcidens TaxID=33524 RepID=A0ABV0UYZ2_9TELE